MLKYYERPLTILLAQESEYSNKEPIGEPFNNIGRLHRQNNSYRKAICYFEKAMNMKLKTMTSQSPNLIVIYLNLGSTQSSWNHFTKAFEYAKLSLEVKQNCMPSDHRSLANGYHTLGNIYSMLTGYEELMRSYEAALVIFQRYPS